MCGTNGILVVFLGASHPPMPSPSSKVMEAKVQMWSFQRRQPWIAMWRCAAQGYNRCRQRFPSVPIYVIVPFKCSCSPWQLVFARAFMHILTQFLQKYVQQLPLMYEPMLATASIQADQSAPSSLAQLLSLPWDLLQACPSFLRLTGLGCNDVCQQVSTLSASLKLFVVTGWWQVPGNSIGQSILKPMLSIRGCNCIPFDYFESLWVQEMVLHWAMSN